MNKTSTKFHQEALPLMVFSYFCRHIIKSTALHGRFLPRRMSPFTKERSTHYVFMNKKLNRRKYLHDIDINHVQLLFPGFLIKGGRVTEWTRGQSAGREIQKPRVQSPPYRRMDLFLHSPEFNPSATAMNSQLVCLRPVEILFIFV